MSEPTKPSSVEPIPYTTATTTYNTVEVGGVRLFYREAGPRDAPAIVLLHGFPSSSRMWERLIPLLADRYHLIAPDYPGFGYSAAPPPDLYAYTFDSLARTTGQLLDHLGLTRYSLFMQDYGGPVGFRMALSAPERVAAMIVQNANAYAEGLGPKWAKIAAYWEDPEAHADQLDAFLSHAATKARHLGVSPHPERYDPDAWNEEFAMLSRPGQRAIQAALLFDYRTNVAAYPRWQAWLRAHQPKMLVIWGLYDPSFIVPGAEGYKRDVPGAELHVIDAGHFGLDEKTEHIARLVRRFMETVSAADG
ncbi:alpha/beta fold hydrolase [Acidisoma sp. 7E03]